MNSPPKMKPSPKPVLRICAKRFMGLKFMKSPQAAMANGSALAHTDAGLTRWG